MYIFDFLQTWITWFNALAGQNQFLVGGIGTVVFGGVMYLVRSIPHTIYLWIRRFSTSEFTINTRNDNYEDFLKILYHSRIQFFSRNYAISETKPELVPGYGVSFGWYAGRPLTFQKRILDNKNNIEEQIDITFFTRKKTVVEQFVREAASDVMEDDLKVYFSSGHYWERGPSKRKRSLDTVFANQNVKDKIVSKIRWFMDNEDWYNVRGIPYKLCIILHGEPGTGKTSLIHAMATEFNANIRFMSDLVLIDNLITHCSKRDFIVVEDIDTLANLKREKDKTSVVNTGKKGSTNSKVVSTAFALHTLLNSIDGFKTPHGTVFFITTNHIDQLDPALIRVGRVDELVEVTPLDENELRAMFKAFYPKTPLKVLENYCKIYTYKPTIGAKLQSLFANNNPEIALQELFKDMTKKRNTK
jgi:chaperone BCS1